MGNYNRIWRIIFWLYITVLFVLVIIKFEGSFLKLMDRVHSFKINRARGFWNVNLIPFKSIGPQLARINQDWALLNIAGNILAFIPFGFLLPLAYPKSGELVRIFIIAFLSVLSIELFQLITMLGIFDVDDIILNVPSILLGYVFLISLQRLYLVYTKKRN